MSIVQAIIGTNLTISGILTTSTTTLAPEPTTTSTTTIAPVFLFDNFTIEWWDKMEGGGDLYPRPWAVGTWTDPSNNHSIGISYEGGQDLFWISNTLIGQAAQNRSEQGWRHNALVRHNGIVKAYVNGTQYFSTVNGNLAIIDYLTKPLFVGYGGTNGRFKGYIKDLHIIKGFAKYTGNFPLPNSPVTPQTGSVFLLPVATELTRFADSIGNKIGTVTGTLVFNEDDPWTWPTQNFTAFAYGGVNIALNDPYLSQPPVIGLKVSDSSGWSDYIYKTDLVNHVTFYNNAPNRDPGEIYTIGEETNPITLNITYTSGSDIEARLSQYPALSPLLAVKAGWTYSGPGGNTGTVPNNAYIVDPNGLARVFLNIPTGASLGTWTFTPPVRGGSLYFDGVSYINFGPSIDWAMDVDNIPSGLTLDLDANTTTSYPGTGATWNDISGNSNNITLVGSPAYFVGPPAYFDFNGTSQYATGAATNLVPQAAYTKVVWFKLDDTTSDNNLVSSDDGGHYMFFANSNRLYAGHSNVPPYFGVGSFGSNATFNIDTWYCVAVTFSVTSGNGIRIYVNGNLDANNAGYLTPHNGDGTVNIACFASGGNLLNGKIGRVLCFNRELTSQEIASVFNVTRNRYGI